ncbi:hypothetical protein ABT061_00835 [Streptosporangium sp. NPDC002544]|uniref:hypothetical protein n=1 Tax=Streptosporangium sp. NPDC002544 TaxID=3154538 RepID=UPI00332CF33C
MRRPGRFPPPLGTGAHAARPDGGRWKGRAAARRAAALTRAALIYQHAGQDRDKVIAKALGQAFKRARNGHGRS